MCLIPQGDNSIIVYEYVEDKEPYLFDVAPFACGSPHQVTACSNNLLCGLECIHSELTVD